MRKLSTHPAGYYPASQTTPVAAKTAKVHFTTLAALLAGLCFITPLYAHAEDTVSTLTDLGNNPLIVLAKFIKSAELPPCKIIGLLSGGRLKVVPPPKMIVNKLMDSVISLASVTK